jgi:hypothetical protein
MEAEEVFGTGFSHSNQIRDSTAYERGYGDGSRVDLHGARTSRLLPEASWRAANLFARVRPRITVGTYSLYRA